MHGVLGTVPGCLHDGSVPASGGFLLGSPHWPSWCSWWGLFMLCRRVALSTVLGPVGFVTGPTEGTARQPLLLPRGLMRQLSSQVRAAADYRDLGVRHRGWSGRIRSSTFLPSLSRRRGTPGLCGTCWCPRPVPVPLSLPRGLGPLGARSIKRGRGRCCVAIGWKGTAFTNHRGGRRKCPHVLGRASWRLRCA